MKEVDKKTARYKIDKDTNGVWEYVVYERKKFLFWTCWERVFKTDYLRKAHDYIENAPRLPLYYA